MSTTLRMLSAVTLLTLAVASSASAQAPAKTAVTDSIKKKFVGNWEGTYFSDHAPESKLTLAVARDTAWKVTMEIVSAQNMPPSTIRDFKVDGNLATWTQELMGMPCESTANFVAGTLKGEIKCGNASIGFLLRKQ